MLIARDLRIDVGPRTLITGASFSVQSGDRIGLVGRNGAGKTTLLRILGLGLAPDSGSLAIDGLDAKGEALRARSRIGWLAHASLLYDDLTARQNLEFWGRLYGVEGIERRARELLSEMGLDGYVDEPAAILSRGMSQRLSLARALVHDPALLLLDEPFTGLDRRAAGRFSERIEAMRRDGRTLVLVTHDVGLAGRCDRIVELDGGRIVNGEA